MERPQNLHEALAEAGYRLTRQRQVVYDTLDDIGGHRTAEEIFREARGAMPRLSLATVYKALESLEEAGLIRKLSSRRGSARYETDTSPHYHARCRVCDRIIDIENSGAYDDAAAKLPLNGFRVEMTAIEFRGLCEKCRGA